MSKQAQQVLVIAGEASGDQHAAAVVAELKRLRPDVTFFGMGGAKLAEQGVELLFSSQEISVMGIAEVLPKVPRILKVLGALAAAAKERRPACALLVDVPDFNLRLAARLKRAGVPVIWYVSPMVWAWRPSRTKVLSRLTERVLCILPFEEAFLRERGVNATYVGNPVAEQVPAQQSAETFRSALGLDVTKPVLALLPGSRRSELARLLPTMALVARRQTEAHAGLQVVIPVAPGIDPSLIQAGFEGSGVTPVLIQGRAAEVVGASDVALVASGTATLEAGLMRRPLVVIYRMAPLSYWVAKAMVRTPFFSLVNLLAGREVVPELLQGEATVERVHAAIESLWTGPARDACLQGLDEVREKIGVPGAASRVAAALNDVLSRNA